MFSRILATLAVAVTLLAACGGQGDMPVATAPGAIGGTLVMTSPAFEPEGMIPAVYTCDGDDVSPPLHWEGLPAGTASLALIVDDPDAPVGTWVHWVVYNLPPDVSGLDAGVPTTAELANGAAQAVNSGRSTGYSGPCPPSGTHRYYFKLYALDMRLDLAPGDASKAAVLDAIEGHVLAQATLMGRYQRQ